MRQWILDGSNKSQPEQPVSSNDLNQSNKEHTMKSKGLYANIAAKKARIKKGSGERMRTPGSKGAPTAKAFRKSALTAKRT
jgi:hypothetical protein